MLVSVRDINGKEVEINPLIIGSVEINRGADNVDITIYNKTFTISLDMYMYLINSPRLGLSVIPFNETEFNLSANSRYNSEIYKKVSAPTVIDLGFSSKAGKIGEQFMVLPTITPLDKNHIYNVISTDNNVVSVEKYGNGHRCTMVGAGTAKIVVITGDGSRAEVDVSVEDNIEMSFEQSGYEGLVGETIEVNLILNSEDLETILVPVGDKVGIVRISNNKYSVILKEEGFEILKATSGNKEITVNFKINPVN